MNLWEYAIACEAGRLMRESDRRELTDKEWALLQRLMPTVERVDRREQETKRSMACPA